MARILLFGGCPGEKMSVLSALLFVSLTAQPASADEPATFELPEKTAVAETTALTHRISGQEIRKRGRITTYSGLGTMAVAVPAGLGVAGALSQNCEFECMAAPLFGAATAMGLLTVGGTVAVAGVVTSAVGRGRERRQVKLGLAGFSGTF